MSARRLLPSLVASTCLAATGAVAGDANAPAGGWRLEDGVAQPSYAVADATRTNLNVETVVLACEAGQGNRLLQLQLYMSDEGALQPTYRLMLGLAGASSGIEIARRFGLDQNVIDAARAGLAEQGMTVSEITRGEIHDSFTLTDPDGHDITVHNSHVEGVV